MKRLWGAIEKFTTMSIFITNLFPMSTGRTRRKQMRVLWFFMFVTLGWFSAWDRIFPIWLLCGGELLHCVEESYSERKTGESTRLEEIWHSSRSFATYRSVGQDVQSPLREITTWQKKTDSKGISKILWITKSNWTLEYHFSQRCELLIHSKKGYHALVFF